MQIKTDATKIKRWREDRGWSQEHLADAAGIAVRTVQRIENGDSASRDSVMALAAAFDVDVLSLTLDPKTEAQKVQLQQARKTKAALRLSFFIHFGSYLFGMITFAGISLADGAPGYAMLVPSIWWTVGVAGHALAVAIVELSQHYKAQAES